MGTAKAHYDSHLGNFYSWMIGDFASMVRRQKDEFAEAGIAGVDSAAAWDLGAGNGVQTVALSDMGYSVTSIDFNNQLIRELRANTANRDVRIVEDDIFAFADLDQMPDLIVCCGDTVAHLPDVGKLGQLISGCYSRLGNGGRLYLSFRDYSRELTDAERFIPVKQDQHRILTCFLEYFENRVRVTDILLEHDGGKWVQKISSYFKIRTSVPMIVRLMEHTGFTICYRKFGGMNVLMGEKIIK
jgi:SAM-dependent methyltransferase